MNRAHKNEGIIPRMRIIDTSSLSIVDLGGLIGNLGAMGFGSLVSFLTTLTICSVSEFAGRYLAVSYTHLTLPTRDDV